MAQTVSVSFREDEEDLYEWMEEQWEEGDYRNRSSVIIAALKEKRERDEDVDRYV